jgi:hypothetical protein
MTERQQERAELVKWGKAFTIGLAVLDPQQTFDMIRAMARFLEEDGKEIERLHHIRDKARQTGSAPYGWYAEMAEHVDKLVDRAEKAEAELARIRKIVAVYFSPWGAAKAAEWEELSGDRGFDPETALRLIDPSSGDNQ